MPRFEHRLLLTAHYLTRVLGFGSLAALILLHGEHRWLNLIAGALTALATSWFIWYILHRDRFVVVARETLFDDISLEGVTPGPWTATPFAQAPGDAKSPPLNTWKIRPIQKTALGSMTEADARFIVEVHNRLERMRGTV